MGSRQGKQTRLEIGPHLSHDIRLAHGLSRNGLKGSKRVLGPVIQLMNEQLPMLVGLSALSDIAEIDREPAFRR